MSAGQLTRCVLDASVGIKLFVEEPLAEQAHRLFDGLKADPPAELYVPDLFFTETANLLWKFTCRFGRPLEDGLADLADLSHLALRVAPTAFLMEDALALAAQTGLNAYEACYASLARRLGLPLVTADERMRKILSTAVWLGDY